MHSSTAVIVLFMLLGLVECPIAANKTLTMRVAASGSSSVGMLGHYTNEGLGGTAGIGWQPFQDSRDVELIASVSYDRFANERGGIGTYSFVLAGAGILLRVSAQQSNGMYLVFDAGPAFVQIDGNNGFPPYRGKSHKSTNLYGAGGAGMIFEVGRAARMYVQIELVDVLDKQFGDYRFFKLSLGLQI